jgi:transcriptional regulator with XRE-family HTH domain
MEDRHMKSVDLAKMLGVSKHAIKRWRHSDRFGLKIHNILNLCDIFNCSIEFITGRSNDVINYTPKPCPPFYERLRALMADKNITRYKIVRDNVILDGYFTNWKRGRVPRLSCLIAIADYMGCTLDYLLGRDDE